MSQTPLHLVPGYRVDRYELLYQIGQGGMGSVWAARLKGRHGFEKLFAIKMVLPEHAAESRFRAMFLDEARICAAIDHPNVAHVVDMGEHHEMLYLVMEWVDGDALQTLHRALARKEQRIPEGIVLRVVSDACRGLHAAHELKDRDGHPLDVVHRDISPHNILVTSRGLAKLIDFGIAKAKHRLVGETSSGSMKGKLHYMPPEQALGMPVDRRADIWAMGAVIYYHLAGRPAYQEANDAATLHALFGGQPPAPLPGSVPRSVAQVVTKALEPEAPARFATALALHQAIEDAMLEAKVHTSTDDVAAFFADNLADRVTARKASLDIALKAADERERVEALLDKVKPSDPSTPHHPKQAESPRTQLGLGDAAPPSSRRPSQMVTVAAAPKTVSVPGVRRGRRIVYAIAALALAGTIVAVVAWRSQPTPVATAATAAVTIPSAAVSSTPPPPPATSSAPAPPPPKPVVRAPGPPPPKPTAPVKPPPDVRSAIDTRK
jgi:serine/threonine-protein kinase